MNFDSFLMKLENVSIKYLTEIFRNLHYYVNLI